MEPTINGTDKFLNEDYVLENVDLKQKAVTTWEVLVLGLINKPRKCPIYNSRLMSRNSRYILFSCIYVIPNNLLLLSLK